MSEELPRMYTDLADWFHLITAPDEYVEEASFYLNTMTELSDRPPQTLLELGSGAGNNAFHYKRQLQAVTLTDLSEGMLRLSRQINPDCEHIQGDMRTLRLGRTFDAVFVHDAVCYLATHGDLQACMRTAFVHCRPGGVTLFAPDHIRENFPKTRTQTQATDSGGRDGEGRAIRWLQWTYDPDPSDDTYTVDYAYILHEAGKASRVIHDRHTCGLFTRAAWLGHLTSAGFEQARALPFNHSELAPGSLEVFVASRPC
jgi:SAM-dependent methyltransferase